MRIKAIAHALLFSALLGTAVQATQAVTMYGRTVIYFNDNEEIVGQSMLSCDSLQQHAGITGTTKRIDISFTCGYPNDPTLGTPRYVVYSNLSENMQSIFCSVYANGNCETGPEPLLDDAHSNEWVWVGGF